MSTIALSGSDTFKINGRTIVDLADADVVKLTFPNEVATLKTGKNGNTLYGLNESGRQAEVEVSVIRGSADDKFLNNLLANERNNFAGFVLMTGEFVKKIGDGTGNITSDTYVCSGGIFNKNVEATSNVEGNTDQSKSTFHMKFSQAIRIIA